MLDLIEFLKWVEENERLYWCLWLGLIAFGYMVFEGIEQCIMAWCKHR